MRNRVIPKRLAVFFSSAALLLFSVLCSAAGLVLVRTARLPEAPAVQTAESVPQNSVPLLVVDPGHGGQDGGASAEGGDVLEKDLNLAVSENVADLCAVFGLPVRLTRTEDVLLYDYFGDLDDYTGKQKTYDLKNRLRIAEESGARLLVSVHMNQFPQASCRGFQVYYSPNDPDSRVAAQRIQSAARSFLDRENDREIKPATSAIYLLKHVRIPAVLAECGFLSNPEERALLVTPDYRRRLAAVLFVPAADYLAEQIHD